MAISKFGINFDLGNITPLNISTPKSAKEWVDKIPETANRLTYNYYGLIVSLSLFLFLYWYMSDLSPFGDFRYSKIRTLGIVSAIVSIVGMVFLYLGFFAEFFHIAIFMIICMISTIWVIKEES